MNIFLDLSIHISHFSSSTFACALGKTIRAPIEGREPDRVQRWRTRSGWKWMTAHLTSMGRFPMDSRGYHTESPKQEKEEDRDANPSTHPDRGTRCTAPALIAATTTEPVSRPSSSLAPLVITARRGKPQSTVTVTNTPCGSISVTRPDR